MGIQLRESKCLKPHSYCLLFWLYLQQNQEEDPDLTFKNGIMTMDLDHTLIMDLGMDLDTDMDLALAQQSMELSMIMDLVLDHIMIMDLDPTMTMDLALTIVHSTAIHPTHQDLTRIIEMFPTKYDCSFSFLF